MRLFDPMFMFFKLSGIVHGARTHAQTCAHMFMPTHTRAHVCALIPDGQESCPDDPFYDVCALATRPDGNNSNNNNI